MNTYYKCTLSAVTHELIFFEHMLILAFFLALVCGTRAQSLSAPFSYDLRIEYSLGQQDVGTQYYEIMPLFTIFTQILIQFN
jgi:hypothetical protein